MQLTDAMRHEHTASCASAKGRTAAHVYKSSIMLVIAQLFAVHSGAAPNTTACDKEVICCRGGT